MDRWEKQLKGGNRETTCVRVGLVCFGKPLLWKGAGVGPLLQLGCWIILARCIPPCDTTELQRQQGLCSECGGTGICWKWWGGAGREWKWASHSEQALLGQWQWQQGSNLIFYLCRWWKQPVLCFLASALGVIDLMGCELMARHQGKSGFPPRLCPLLDVMELPLRVWELNLSRWWSLRHETLKGWQGRGAAVFHRDVGEDSHLWASVREHVKARAVGRACFGVG